MSLTRILTTLCSALLLIVWILCVSVRARADPPDGWDLLLFSSWRVIDEEVHCVLHLPAAELQRFVRHFWAVQTLLAQHDLANGYLLWVDGGRRPFTPLAIREVNVVEQTLICSSPLPFHISALQVLRALGCHWPES